MSPANEAECRKRIKEHLIQFIDASRANMRAPVPPTVIDPARDDLRKNGRGQMSPERESDCIKRIIEASRAKRRAVVQPTVIDPAKYRVRADGMSDAASIANAWAEHERAKAAAKAEMLALLTILEDITQSRSVAERCAKAKAVLS